MGKIQQYQENIFSEIGKLLSGWQLQKTMDSAEDTTSAYPNLKTSIDALGYHATELKKYLPSFCKRYPDSPVCKNLRK